VPNIPWSVTREDEDGLLAGEFYGIPSRREQPNQWPRTYYQIQYSNRPDPQENSRGRMTLQETSSYQKSSSTNAFQNSNRHNNYINFNINFDLEFSIIKDGTEVQISKNPLIKILVKKWMKQIASNSNVKNTQAYKNRLEADMKMKPTELFLSETYTRIRSGKNLEISIARAKP
jgi:hypothetical protein